MSDFTASACTGGQLDPRKRVNYALGMVLGEDEFQQEQLYLRERDHRAVRALHGFGTVAGLGVDLDQGQVVVHPGLAVDQAGRFMCVPADQCASLPDWIAGHHDDVVDQLSSGSPGAGGLSVYVILCYRECETDKVPLPSEPCQTDDESMAATRITDSFELKLAFDPPALDGELAGPGLADLLEEVVHLEQISGSPPYSPPGEPFAFEEVRELLRQWVVRLRPELADRPCLAAPDEACVLLARIDLDMELHEGGEPVLAGTPAVVDDERPLLLSTRLLQEWLARLTASEKVRLLDDLEDVDTAGGHDGDVLTLEQDLWVPRTPIRRHNQLQGLDADDHPQYYRLDGVRALTGDLAAGGHRLTGLADGTDPQDAVALSQLANVLKVADPAGGDLGGTYPNPTVTGLQGRPVATQAPDTGFVLTWDGTQWVPQAAGDGGDGAPQRIFPLATITPLGDLRYEVWFNLDATRNPVAVEKPEESLRIVAETDGGATFLTAQLAYAATPQHRNVFLIRLQKPPTGNSPYLRFVFILEALPLDNGVSAAEYARKEQIVYEGLDPKRAIVTRFVRDPNLQG